MGKRGEDCRKIKYEGLDRVTEPNVFFSKYLEKRFDLSNGYFKRAKKQNTKLNAKVFERFGGIFVAVPDEVADKINKGYISTKVNNDDCLGLYDYVFQLTKSTSIGFYKENEER